jgi:tetrapyrrole methylase family protein / MazG family protein
MDIFSGITLLGLGPGDPGQLTRQAWDWLNQIDEVVLRTRQHAAVASFRDGLKVSSFDDLYERNESIGTVSEQIVQQVLALGGRSQGVTYAVPGHPMIADATGPEIWRRAKEEGIAVRLIEGLSFIEPVVSALGINPMPHCTMVDALELATLHHPSFPPDQPAFVAQIYNQQVAANVKLTLNAVYPDEHPVRLVHATGTLQPLVEDLKLFEIDRSPHIGPLTGLYLPPLDSETSFERFQEIVAALRAPDGCPWDREQTHESLRRYLLEETYEALAGLDENDPSVMQEEFGDLLLQIVLHAQIGYEDGEFSMADIIQGISRKLIRRHPHVFGEVQVDGVKGVLQNWEKLKAAERKANGQETTKGLLDGVPKEYPALGQAQQIQDRAARVGFDWDNIQGVWDKVHEEIAEVREASSDAERVDEVGDLLFAAVNLARWLKVDAESALRGTNLKFRRRFSHVEKRARESGRQLMDMNLPEMDVFWDEAKKLE